MTSLIPNFTPVKTSYLPAVKQEKKEAAVEPKQAQSKPVELANLPTSNILAQFVKKQEKIAAVDLGKPLQRYEWKNDLRQLMQENKAVIWAMVPRTFNSKDRDGNDLVQEGEEKGTFLNAVERLDEIKALGVNTFHVLPINPPGSVNAMGLSGSVYAPYDLLQIDPELRDPNDPHDVKDQFKMFIDECHKRDIRVMLDLPSCASCDLYHAKPELMAHERDGNPKTPQGWNDIRMFEPWEDETKRTLNPHLMNLHKAFVDMCIDLKVDGIRADVARAKPSEFWDVLIPYSRSKDPNFAWLAETYTYEDASAQMNMMYDRPKDNLKAGFDSIYGQYHIFNEMSKAKDLTDYVKMNLNMSNEKGMEPGKSLIGSFATHDDVSPMFHGGVDYCNLTTGLQATLPMLNPYFVDGFQSGDYYVYKYENLKAEDQEDEERKLDVHRGKLDIFNHSRKPSGKHPEIGEFVKSSLKVRDKYSDVITKGSFIPLKTEENADDQIIAFARHHEGKTLLVVANRDVNKREKGLVKVPGLKEGTKLENLTAPYGQKSYFQVNKDGQVAVDMGKARFHVFEVDTPNIEKEPGLEVLKQKL